jgi:16S rRNA C1402 (ribose-2'-O) methylase RsmI
VVAFESPQRLPKSLRSLAAFEPAREVAVCRELTKRFEEVARGTSALELAERFAEPPKGEITLVLGPGSAVSDPAEAPGGRRRPRHGRDAAARGGRRRRTAHGHVPKRALPRLSVTNL